MHKYWHQKWKILIAIILCSNVNTQAQYRRPAYPEGIFSEYYYQRVSFFKTMPRQQGEVIFLGNSITDGAEWAQLFADLRMVNHGISGDITAGVIQRLPVVAERRPQKVFLLVGTNDLARGIAPDSVLTNIRHIAAYMRHSSPDTKLYVQSILPVNESFGKFSNHTKNASTIQQLNVRIKEAAQHYGYTFIDIASALADENGKLKKEYTNDGLHLTGPAYHVWKHAIYAYLYGREKHPALIPMPQKVEWTEAAFPMYTCKQIYITDRALLPEAIQLQSYLANMGWQVTIANQQPRQYPCIVLKYAQVEAAPNAAEAYTLTIDNKQVCITANGNAGVFYGIQTLLQTMRSGSMAQGCSITDWPAFGWRGYMIDVGRNYMSLPLLKQQIDVMARQKLNIFHLHATEDIAWRLQIMKYPQLIAPETMLRNKGMYYSLNELQELIQYCKARHITLVPEIDMPGHSAAFTRAMKTDMQTDSGLAIVKEILTEFCTTYDVPYIHIGADEVKITNPQFVPEVTRHIEQYGKKVIGWQPGGNFTNSTLRQLWMDDNSHTSSAAGVQFIDSRHLYINHMDPLEAVVTIYNRMLGNVQQGDSVVLGATLCLWHDRNVGRQEDMLQMNPVYPGILAFAERSWQGGGTPGWVAHTGRPNSPAATAFAAFENRLLDHKAQYFSTVPFPYSRQANQVWQLAGPFANQGQLGTVFPPEKKGFDWNKSATVEQVGGTIVLRHWWYPLIAGAVEAPKDSSTWYATTRIWSDADTIQAFWIGFNNLSRSPATDTPPAGEWDTKQSKIWLNGLIIEPPVWKRSGGKGHAEIPLYDEGYEYRSPTHLRLQKGWNTVLVKLPVGSFKGKDWQNPVKWMFTFVPAP